MHEVQAEPLAREAQVLVAVGRPRASVVIPAHNEQRRIGDTVSTLLRDATPGEFEVIIVCNGCRDDTAGAARAAAAAVGAKVTVVELAEASKPAALRAGDRHASAFPRIYLDADVNCPTATVRAIIDTLLAPGTHLAVPSRQLDTSAASWLASLHGRTWAALPWVQAMLSGRGLYAVDRTGRARLGAFPDIIADDLWMTAPFDAGETRIVPFPVVVETPRRIRDIVRVRARVLTGNGTLARTGAAGVTGGRSWSPSGLLGLARQPRTWPGLAVYLVVEVRARWLARRLDRDGPASWLRDGSTRGLAAERGRSSRGSVHSSRGRFRQVPAGDDPDRETR